MPRSGLGFAGSASPPVRSGTTIRHGRLREPLTLLRICALTLMPLLKDRDSYRKACCAEQTGRSYTPFNLLHPCRKRTLFSRARMMEITSLYVMDIINRLPSSTDTQQCYLSALPFQRESADSTLPANLQQHSSRVGESFSSPRLPIEWSAGESSECPCFNTAQYCTMRMNP